MDYGDQIRAQVDEFVADFKAEFSDVYDWIEAIDSESSLGLDHLDGAETPEEVFNQNPLEISVGVSLDGLTQDDIDECDAALRSFADQRGVSIRMTEASPGFTVYTVYLHGDFLDVSH